MAKLGLSSLCSVHRIAEISPMCAYSYIYTHFSCLFRLKF